MGRGTKVGKLLDGKQPSVERPSSETPASKNDNKKARRTFSFNLELQKPSVFAKGSALATVPTEPAKGDAAKPASVSFLLAEKRASLVVESPLVTHVEKYASASASAPEKSAAGNYLERQIVVTPKANQTTKICFGD